MASRGQRRCFQKFTVRFRPIRKEKKRVQCITTTKHIHTRQHHRWQTGISFVLSPSAYFCATTKLNKKMSILDSNVILGGFSLDKQHKRCYNADVTRTQIKVHACVTWYQVACHILAWLALMPRARWGFSLHKQRKRLKVFVFRWINADVTRKPIKVLACCDMASSWLSHTCVTCSNATCKMGIFIV